MADIGGLFYKVVENIYPHLFLKFRLDQTNGVAWTLITKGSLQLRFFDLKYGECLLM